MRASRFVILAVLSMVAVSGATIEAQTPESFEEARVLSAQSHRLILMEFYRDG